jgi:hypothetical protein
MLEHLDRRRAMPGLHPRGLPVSGGGTVTVDSTMTDDGLEKVNLSGGKRTRIAHSDWIDGWWVGYGKDESCQFEGPWQHLAILAAKILRHPNTQRAAPNLYQPDIALTEEQERNY